MASKKKTNVTYVGTGRRKSSVARVFMTAGTGVITVNGKTYTSKINITSPNKTSSISYIKNGSIITT